MTRSDVPLVVCPECGAENNSFANVCWICRSPLYTGKEETVEAELVPPTASSGRGKVASRLAASAFGMLVLGTVPLALGALANSLDGLVSFLLVVLPLVVVISAFILRGSQSESKWIRHLSFAVSALVVTIGTVILLGIATIIALFAFCLMLIAGH
ncbi:hypothetical protein DTL42_01250 [Bremerella cremea]|uniref:Uncharacterized protein n=1 Tax=Bremerella cremea TaxID=1031537 RepID=A0A368KXS0_9BACT|nr:hypothetical protein [Bremerella cremea]RCS56043.1 hypothetical protein DTL42_01250 [Bremerella cremea]